MSSERTLGLILAGGLSRRMGEREKALLPLAGRPMLAHVVERLRPQCATLVINANGDAARFAGFGLPVLADDPPDFAGPLAGVLAGLEYAGRHAPHLTHVASIAADTPFAPPDCVARLSAALAASGAEIAVAASGGRRHHAVAVWPVALAAGLRRALIGEGLRKVDAFLRRHRVVEAEWPTEPADPFFNVNTAEDLARGIALASLIGSAAPDGRA